jgi:hypothetical protein
VGSDRYRPHRMTESDIEAIDKSIEAYKRMIKYLEKQISQLQQKKVEKCCFKKQNITRLKIKRITNA